MRQPADENVLAERSERTKRKERTKFQCKFSDMTEEIPADIFQTYSTYLLAYLFTVNHNHYCPNLKEAKLWEYGPALYSCIPQYSSGTFRFANISKIIPSPFDALGWVGEGQTTCRNSHTSNAQRFFCRVPALRWSNL